MGKKDKKLMLSPALLYSGMIPILRKKIALDGYDVTVFLWFNDIIVRQKFFEQTVFIDEQADFEFDYLSFQKLTTKEYTMDLHMGKFIYKIGKKKIKSVPLSLVCEFYQQYVERVVDKI